jgi:flagellin
MIINNNITAINTRNQLYNTNAAAAKSMEKLSSGKRINRAADDAAGLSISEKMRAQIRQLNQSVRNSQNQISMIQTAEGALDEVSNMLVRLTELAEQLNDTTLASADQNNLKLEMTSLGSAITNIYTNTTFNGTTVLGTAVTVGASSSAASIAAAITTVNGQRSAFGATQNKLESVVRNTKTMAENLQAAESRIRDADMAEEMSNFTKNNILIQAGTAMLAQANQAPQNVLALLR